jgi:hypothetical protein
VPLQIIEYYTLIVQFDLDSTEGLQVHLPALLFLMVNMMCLQMALMLKNTSGSMRDGLPLNVSLAMCSTSQFSGCIKDVFLINNTNGFTVTPMIKWRDNRNSRMMILNYPF